MGTTETTRRTPTAPTGTGDGQHANARFLTKVYRALFSHYGPQGWWPGRTPFEVMVGAILTQNTNWGNVEKAIERLRKEKVLDPESLQCLPHARIAELIRPAGYFNVKARRLHSFLAFFVSGYGGNPAAMRKQSLHRLREELLEVNGIGPETADSILLYAVGFPVFVVDAYTIRVFSRHGLIGADASYDVVQALFMNSLPRDTELFNEYHALIVRVGKEYCGKRAPRCEGCPLESLIP